MSSGKTLRDGRPGNMSTDLVQTTLATLTIPGVTHGDAARMLVDGLNADLGTAYDTARLGQWRRGERAIPQPVQDWMLRASISHAIRQAGGVPPPTDEAIDALATSLQPPRRDKSPE